MEQNPLSESFEEVTDKQYKALQVPLLNPLTNSFIEGKSLVGANIYISNYIENAKAFYIYQPYFYDKSGLWWIWKENKWQIADDIDMESMLDKALGYHGQSISSSIRNNNLRAMMWTGREKTPKEAPKKWIQFKDKAFSLNSKNIYQVTKDYFFTNPIPYELGEFNDTPTMDRLFEEWVGKDYVRSLYEIISYCCYSDYPIQSLICLYGAGRNGKSCFLRLLAKFLGKDNTASTELDSLLDSRFESFKIYKKLCCIMGETNFGVLDKSSMLKKLTGGDMIGFEKKGKDPFNDYSYAKLIIASNSLPSSNDTSEGFYRRWFIIDFPNQFCEGKDILQDIPEQEYNNLARKCMDILPELLAKGSFDKQGSTEERKTKYILSSNPLPYFIDMCCIKDAHNYISYNELYTNYVTFLNANKRRIVKLKEFKEALIQEGLFVEKTSKKINDEFVSGYFVMGLRIKDDFMTIMTIMTRNHTPKFSFVGELKKQSQLSQLSQKCLDFEEKVVSNFDKRQIIYIKCNIVECNSKECNLDSTETPYCQEHWEDNAL